MRRAWVCMSVRVNRRCCDSVQRRWPFVWDLWALHGLADRRHLALLIASPVERGLRQSRILFALFV
jgi:hypothetical protein